MSVHRVYGRFHSHFDLKAVVLTAGFLAVAKAWVSKEADVLHKLMSVVFFISMSEAAGFYEQQTLLL